MEIEGSVKLFLPYLQKPMGIAVRILELKARSGALVSGSSPRKRPAAIAFTKRNLVVNDYNLIVASSVVVNDYNLIVASSVLASCAHADLRPHEEN